MPGLEFVSTGDENGTPMVIAGVDIGGVYSNTERGGEQAPEHKVEEGFDFTTRVGPDRKSTRLNSSHIQKSRMPSSA